MIFVIKENFEKQLEKLSKSYKWIRKDFLDFQENFDLKSAKHLWKWIYKFRIKNSSIPTWKSWGFRIIILIRIEENKAMPFIIYSKTEKENVTFEEIIKELQKYI